jgi:DNA-binding transcriptional MerR regulator
MFKIGDFSRFSRVTVKMLRHYDEIGLLKPARVDPFTGYRYYTADQLPRLNRIIALKDLGFTLEQIGSLLDDIFPMARALDLSVTAWGVIGQGALTGKYNTPNNEPKREADTSPKNKTLAERVMRLADDIGQTPAQVAINYVRAQQGNVIPVIGARTAAQMRDNLGALDFTLDAEQVAQLNDATDFRVDFPLSFLTNDHVRGLIFGETFPHIDNHRVPVTP